MARGFAVAVAAAAALAACGSEPSGEVPAACTQGPAAVAKALSSAPGDVRLGGIVLSECFPRGGDAGGVQAVGFSFLPVAERLAADARAHPRGIAAVRLGFLIGSVRRGASRAGVYAELRRRIEQELTGVDTQSPAFARGLRGGLGHG